MSGMPQKSRICYINWTLSDSLIHFPRSRECSYFCSLLEYPLSVCHYILPQIHYVELPYHFRKQALTEFIDVAVITDKMRVRQRVQKHLPSWPQCPFMSQSKSQLLSQVLQTHGFVCSTDGIQITAMFPVNFLFISKLCRLYGKIRFFSHQKQIEQI